MRRFPYTIEEFEDPDKRELEEWLVIDHRLREVEEALNLVHSALGKSRKMRQIKGSTVATRGSYCFAAVTYVRCFSSGRHRRLSIGSIPNLTPTNLEAHENVRELRNTFFAHAVGDHEGESVYFCAPVGKPKDGFTTISVVLLSDSKRGVRSFMNLVAKVRQFVVAQSQRVGDVIAVRHFGSGSTWKELSKSRQA